MTPGELQAGTSDRRRTPAMAVVEGIIGFFQKDLFRRRWAWAILLAALLFLCIVRTYLGGPIPMKRYGPDAFILLDGAWRVLHGQIPHVDFYTTLGPVMYLLVAVGMKLASLGAATALSYAQALAGAVFALWSFGLARRRLAPVPAVIFSCFAVLLALAPYNIDESAFNLAPSTTYNRYSYVLLALILLEAVCQPRSAADAPRVEWFGGISTGIAVGISLFLKISFFFAAILLAAALLPCRRQQRSRWDGVVTGFALIFFIALIYLHGHLGIVYSDLSIAARAKRVPLRGALSLLSTTFGTMTWVIILSFFTAFLPPTAQKGQTPSGVWWSPLYSAFVVCVVNYLVTLGNTQDSGAPLAVAFAIILSSWISGNALNPKPEPSSAPLRCLLLVGSLLIFLPPILSDVIGLGYGAAKSFTYHSSSVLEFDSRTLRPLLFMGGPSSRDFGSPYVDCINQGIETLRKLPENVTITTLGYTNPFSYALGRRPAHGGATYLASGLGANFTAQLKPPPERILGDASVVMVSKYLTDGGAVEVFGDFVAQNYRLFQDGQCWATFVRK